MIYKLLVSCNVADPIYFATLAEGQAGPALDAASFNLRPEMSVKNIELAMVKPHPRDRAKYRTRKDLGNLVN